MTNKTRQDQCLPCGGMEIEQPSICFSHTDHSLGNSIEDQRNTCLSVDSKYSGHNVSKISLKSNISHKKPFPSYKN